MQSQTGLGGSQTRVCTLALPLTAWPGQVPSLLQAPVSLSITWGYHPPLAGLLQEFTELGASGGGEFKASISAASAGK